MGNWEERASSTDIFLLTWETVSSIGIFLLIMEERREERAKQPISCYLAEHNVVSSTFPVQQSNDDIKTLLRFVRLRDG